MRLNSIPRLRNRRVVGALLFAWVAVLSAVPARAQQRPLVTEDPEVVGGGRVLVEGGIDYGRDIFFPASGLTGDLLRAPLIGISVGLSSIAELQIDGGLFNSLSITDRREAPLSDMLDIAGNTTSDVEDVVVATKIRVVTEGTTRPAIGLRLATKLPTTSNEAGIGLDTTDFSISGLVAKTVQSIRVVGNVGVAILGDPTRGDAQNDVLAYGLSLARALTDQTEVVGEVNGRAHVANGTAAPGTESRSSFRFGARYTNGMLRVDGGIIVGLTTRDPGFGLTAGATYVFDAFQVP
jgi:hypothetical protein